MNPMTLQELVDAVQGMPVRLSPEAEFRGVSIDSRSVVPGNVFWAFSGANSDGHEFLSQAQQAGAVASVVRKDRVTDRMTSVIAVEDTGRALEDFARWNRRRCEALMIGVTGSVGKTTTREMIYSVLSEKFHGLRNQKNFNNEIGLPLTLLELGPEDEFAVLEMGARRVGEIASLCELSQPEIGVITRIAPSHLETFGSLENIQRGKGELFAALPSSGFAVLGGDDSATRDLAGRAPCRVIRVGVEPWNDLRAEQIEVEEGVCRFVVSGAEFEIPAMGRHHVAAALCAIAVGTEVGMSLDEVARGLLRFQPVEGRAQVEHCGAWTVINDTYNASPASMQAACELLQDWKGTGKKVLVVGDMLELGNDSEKLHRELGVCSAASGIDRLLTLGRQSRHAVSGAARAGMQSHSIGEFSEVETLCAVLDCWLDPGDVILVKGSRGMRMERVVEWLRKRSRELEQHELQVGCLPQGARACA